MFLNDILVPYIVKNFSDYNCYPLDIHLASRLNIQELYCYEFYEICKLFKTNLIVFTNVQKYIYIILIDLDDIKLYSVLRMLSYICIQSPFPLFLFPPFLFIKYIYVYIYYICNLLSFSY
jgi:hypothetical protein